MNAAASLPSTYAECLPYMCGAAPFNYAMRYSCSANGFQGAKSCQDPECQPWCPNATQAPAVQAAAVSLHFNPKLTSQNLVRPIPAITDSLHAVPLADLSPICQLNQAIANHPVIASGILIGLFALLSGGKRGRR